MANFWESERKVDNRSRNRSRFQRDASREGFRRAASLRVRELGLDPDTIPELRTSYQAPDSIRPYSIDSRAATEYVKRREPQQQTPEEQAKARILAVTGRSVEVTKRLRRTFPNIDDLTTKEERLRFGLLTDSEIKRMEEEHNVGLPVRLHEADITTGELPGELQIGSPGGEAPMPGVMGKIPGMRTPAEIGATIGTAGIGTTGSIVARAIQAAAGTALGSAGARGGGAIAPEVGLEEWQGELVGGLLGGVVGYGGARAATGRVRTQPGTAPFGYVPRGRQTIQETVEQLERAGRSVGKVAEGAGGAKRALKKGEWPESLEELDIPLPFKSRPESPGFLYTPVTDGVEIQISLHGFRGGYLAADITATQPATLRHLTYIGQRLNDILSRNPSLEGVTSEVVNPRLARIFKRLGFESTSLPHTIRGDRFEFTFTPEQVSALARGRRAPGGLLDTDRVANARASQEPDLPTPLTMDLGEDALQAVLASKEEALLSPGNVTRFMARLPGIKQGMGVLNPSVDLDRGVLVGYNSRKAVIASLETEFDAIRQPAVRELQDAWKAETLAYTGPADNPFKHLLKDWADNPDFYGPASPRLKAAASQFDQVSNRILGVIRNQFGVDIGIYKPSKTGAFYTPTVASKESLENMTERLFRESVEGTNVARWEEPFENTAQRLVKGRSRTRVYEGAYQRWQGMREFAPEQSLETLISAHDSSLARMAGWQTFKKGTKGLTKVQAIETTARGSHLIQARKDTTGRLSNLRTRYNTAKQQLMRLGMTERKLQSLRRGTERKLDPVYDRIDELGDEYGSALSHLSGEAHQLEVEIRTLDRGLKSVGKTKAKIEVGGLKSEMSKVKQELDGLRAAYANIDPTPYRLHKGGTNLYHLEPEIKSMDAVLETSLGKRGDQLAGLVDEIRMTAFAMDASPLSIQGLLGAFSDPVTAIRNSNKIVTQVVKGDLIQQIARDEPDLVRRFTMANTRRFGEAGPEIHMARRGLERIPVVGPAVNRRLMGAVEILRYELWKNRMRDLRKWNPEMTEAVADHEAANFLSKVIPALNMSERGLSVSSARFERMPLISPSFLASPGLLMKDATSGLLKLTARTVTHNPTRAWQSLRGREQLAIVGMVRMAGTMTTLSTASALISAESRGWTPEQAVKAVLDPASPQFMSIILGDGGTVGLGGPFRSFVRGMSPRYVEGELIPFAGLLNFVRGKATPPLAVAADLVRNRDYLNRKIVRGDFPINVLTTLWYITESFAPLSAGSVMEKFRIGERNPIGMAKEAVSQILGTNYREMTAWEQLEIDRDELAEESHSQSWEELEPYQKASLQKAHPDKLDRPEARTDRGKAMEDRRQIGTVYQDLQVQSDGTFPVGPDWIDDYKKLREQQSGAYDLWDRNHQETATWLEGLGSADPNELALSEYRQVFSDSRMYSDPQTGDPIGPLNIESFVLGLNKLEARWTPEQKSYIERNTGIHDTPRVRDYKRDMEALSEYWEVEEQVWQEIRKTPEYQPYATLEDFISVKAQELMAQGTPVEQVEEQLSRYSIVRHAGRMLEDLRFRLRIRQPKLDSLLVKWYGMVPAASRRNSSGRSRSRSR